MIYDVIIVGGGASGIYLLNLLKDKKVLLIEKESELAKKLLISGKSQCNFTHSGDLNEFYEKYGNHRSFVKKALYNFTNVDVINYMKQLGVESFVREDGKVFPTSLDSYDIVAALIKNINKSKIKLSETVKEISKKNGEFHIKTSEANYKSKEIVIATGGKSYGVTGSTGDGYKFAEKFKIKLTQLSPALTPVYIEKFDLVSYAGIAFENFKVNLIRDNKLVQRLEGDFLITHKGFSGPLILDNSRYIEEGDFLEINFSDKSIDEFNRKFIEESKENGKKLLITFMRENIVSNRIAEYILKKLELKHNLKLSEINKLTRKKISKYSTMKNYKIESKGGFNIAMVTCGGVDLSEINSKTMEAKKVNGIYFIGEVLDIDGDSGGYNIQWAFSSAKLCSENLFR